MFSKFYLTAYLLNKLCFSIRYFKPYPRCTIDEATGTCTLQLPNSCPIQSVTVAGDKKILKQLACLEACKKLHAMKALTDSLVPDIVAEESLTQEFGNFQHLLLLTSVQHFYLDLGAHLYFYVL